MVEFSATVKKMFLLLLFRGISLKEVRVVRVLEDAYAVGVQEYTI